VAVFRFGPHHRDDQGKFTELGEIDGSEQAHPVAVAEPIKQREDGEETGEHEKPGQQQGQGKEAGLKERVGDHHP